MRAVLTLAATLVAGNAVASPSDCIAIDTDLDRLACYDREAGRTPRQERLPSKNDWKVQREVSKITDDPNVLMFVESDEEINCGWNDGGKISLVIRCHENTTSLYFVTGCHMTSGDYTDYGDITYRLDDDKARTVSGQESTNNRSLGMWGGARSIPVIKQMLGKSQMVVRMTPYGENPFTATFNIAGLDEAISPLREACHW